MANSVYLTVCDALSHIVSRRAAENIVRDALRVGRTNPDQVTPREMQDLLKGQVFARLQQIIPVAQARGEIKTLLGQLEKMAKAAPKTLSPEVREGLEALRAEFEPYEGLEHPRAQRIRSGIESLPESPDPNKALNSLWAELDVLLNEVGTTSGLETLTDTAKSTLNLPPVAAPLDLDDDAEPFPLEMDDVVELEADAPVPLAESPVDDVDLTVDGSTIPGSAAAQAITDLAKTITNEVNSNDEESFKIAAFDDFGLEFEMEERPPAQPPTLELAPESLPDATPQAATLEPVVVPQPEPMIAPVAEFVPAAVIPTPELVIPAPELVAVAASEPMQASVAASRTEVTPPPFNGGLPPIPTSAGSSHDLPSLPSEQDELRDAFDNEAGLEASTPVVQPPVPAAPPAAPSAPVMPQRRQHAKLNLTAEAQELLLSRFALEEGVIGVTLSGRMGDVLQARMREGSDEHLAGMAAATAMLLERKRSFDVFYTDLGEANVFIAPLGEALLTVLADRSVNVGRVLSEVKTVKEEL